MYYFGFVLRDIWTQMGFGADNSQIGSCPAAFSKNTFRKTHMPLRRRPKRASSMTTVRRYLGQIQRIIFMITTANSLYCKMWYAISNPEFQAFVKRNDIILQYMDVIFRSQDWPFSMRGINNCYSFIFTKLSTGIKKRDGQKYSHVSSFIKCRVELSEVLK